MKRQMALLFGTFLVVAAFCISSKSVEAGSAAWSASGDYGVDFWREAEGLPQSRIRSILQSRDGYLWLGTDNGLVRFNGADFTAFTVESGSLRDNEVWALQEDDYGGLWIGTYGGGLTLYKDGRFKTYTTNDGLPDDVIRRLAKDREGNIWLTTSNGAARFSRGVFTQFTTRDGLTDNSVTALCANSSQGVLIATGNTLHRFVNGKFEVVTGLIEKDDGQITQLLAASDGSVWIGLYGKVKHWKDGSFVRYSWPHGRTSRISQLHEDPQHTIWIATEHGISRLRDGAFQDVELGDRTTNLGVVYSLYGDREGNIWIGFQSNGLGRLRARQLRTISASDGLPNDSTRSVFQDSKGNIWIGTVDGFAKFENGRKTVDYQFLNGARVGSVRSLAEDRDGHIWVGADQDLLILQNGLLSKVRDWKSDSEIEVIYREPKTQHMWVGTDGDGLFEFDGNNVRHYRTQDGLAGNQIRGILSDRHGALWISTSGKGVSKYADGQFVSYTTRDGLAGNRVSAIHEDEEGALWFATREGLSRLKDGRFVTYSAETGLLVRFVYAILDDDQGNFWFSCAKGLFRVSKGELRAFAAGQIEKVNSVDYGVSDGMKTRAYNAGDQPTAWKTTDGSLLFCSMKGVVVVDPRRLVSNSIIPPVQIERVLINKQEQLGRSDLQLPLGGGEVEIHYAALSFTAPEKVRFKYKLEGYDKDWVDAGTRRFAYYANLPPGHYSFKVKAGHIDGPWNETGQAFSFYLKPHFYQTLFFLALVIVVVLLIVGSLYRLHMIELKARYSAVLGERNRIAREIHDTLAQNLAGIALQLDSVNMQSPEIPAGLRQRLDQACNLVRYSLSEARRAVADLRSDELEQRELAVVLPLIANKMADGLPVEVQAQVFGPPRRLSPTVEKNLLRIFQEAMANAVKHADARRIDIELRYELDCLVLWVRDDGSGFDTERIIPLGVGHYGLTGMRERAERIGGRFTLKSKLGHGTELLVEVPLST
jgi:ligand-binding sensor domain-containing protein/two-component sensor histidine kinase